MATAISTRGTLLPQVYVRRAEGEVGLGMVKLHRERLAAEAVCGNSTLDNRMTKSARFVFDRRPLQGRPS